MAKKLQILRGTTAQNDAYTGSIGELTMDTEKGEVRIHDGTTIGGKIIGSGGANLPILTHVFSDHKLNDISWLNADTFSWQSGDVYVAAYEHLANEVVIETETKKYIRCKKVIASGDYRDDDNVYYREPSYDFTSGEEQYEGYTFAWVAASSNMMVITNTETPAESDVVHYYSKIYPEEPSPSSGRVVEAGEETFYSNAETETVDDITITFYRAEDGHKICLPDQEANVQALYEATGVAWYYILDQENKRFKLPRTKHAFTGLRDSVGKYVPAGVPDIAGHAEVVGYTTDGTWQTSGGMSGSIWTRKTGGAISESGQEFDGQLRFAASRSNSIYGNSNTVQPPATQMYLYFYVGNFEQSALEQTAGITSEQLNNKADSDLKNTPLRVEPTGKILVSNQLFAQSTNNRELRLQVGDDVTNGSLLALYGQNSTQGAVGFLLRACLTPGEYNDLVGRTDGNLLWKGERISCLESEQLPTIANGYLWYKVYDDGFVIQGGRCTGTWEIAQGKEQIPYVTMAIPMNTTHIYPFFTCKEVYCLPMGWYMGNSTTLRPRFGAYTTNRTLTQFDWVVFGRKA